MVQPADPPDRVVDVPEAMRCRFWGPRGHEMTSTSYRIYWLSRNRIFEAIVLNASANADESAAMTKSPVGCSEL